MEVPDFILVLIATITIIDLLIFILAALRNIRDILQDIKDKDTYVTTSRRARDERIK